MTDLSQDTNVVTCIRVLVHPYNNDVNRWTINLVKHDRTAIELEMSLERGGKSEYSVFHKDQVMYGHELFYSDHPVIPKSITVSDIDYVIRQNGLLQYRVPTACGGQHWA
jgi:hypothetical protein